MCSISRVNPIDLAITDIDILNSYIGTVEDIIYLPDTKCILESIQEQLIKVNGMLYTNNIQYDTLKSYIQDLSYDCEKIKALGVVPDNFVIPKGPLHYCRSLAYRCAQSAFNIPSKDVSKYLSQLSYYFFLLSLIQ